MARRVSRSDGLRELLVACREHRLSGCPSPGPWVGRGRDELLEALKSGDPVEVGSADLMIAPMHGGQDYRRYAHGGADADKLFVLDENGRLTALPD